MKKSPESMAGTPKIEDPLFQKFRKSRRSMEILQTIRPRNPPPSTTKVGMYTGEHFVRGSVTEQLAEGANGFPSRCGSLRNGGSYWTVMHGGKIMKGSQLIDEFNGEEEICSEYERSVCSSVGGSSSGFSSCDSSEEEVEKTGVVVEERTNGGTTDGVVMARESTNGGTAGGISRWMVAKDWFAEIVVAVCHGLTFPEIIVQHLTSIPTH